MSARTFVVFALALAASCGFQGEQRTRSMLRVKAVPEEARVFVDDRFVATARVLGRQPVALRPGHHLLTITAPGYFPHDMELTLPTGETKVEVQLRAVPP